MRRHSWFLSWLLWHLCLLLCLLLLHLLHDLLLLHLHIELILHDLELVLSLQFELGAHVVDLGQCFVVFLRFGEAGDGEQFIGFDSSAGIEDDVGGHEFFGGAGVGDVEDESDGEVGVGEVPSLEWLNEVFGE